MRRTFLCDGRGQKNSIISIKRFDIVLKKHIAGVRITNLFVVLSRKFSTAAIQYTHFSSWCCCCCCYFCPFLLLLCFSVKDAILFRQRACVCVYVCVLCGYLVGQIMCNYRCRSDAYKLFRTKFKLLNTWLSIEFIHWIHQQAKIVGFSVCPLQFLPVLVGSRAAQSIWFGYHVCITTPE